MMRPFVKPCSVGWGLETSQVLASRLQRS
jgi:hypothetical protein